MRIENIFPHPSEDDLDVVTLGPGIKCVVHKGQFEVGDCVKLVPAKTVKKGIICHGLIVKEEDYIEFETEAGKTTLIIQPTEPFVDPDSLEDLDPDYHGDPSTSKPFSVAEAFAGGSDILHRKDENSFKAEMYLTQVDPKEEMKGD